MTAVVLAAALLTAPMSTAPSGEPDLFLGVGQGLRGAPHDGYVVFADERPGQARNLPQGEALGSEGPAPQFGGAPMSTVTGTATHYCLPGQGGTSYCTAGYGPQDLVAAIDRRDTPWDKGDRLLVTSGSRSVVVRIVDVCACKGRRLIDLSSGAFRRLAPLGRGVIPVTLTEVGSVRLPATDTVAPYQWREHR